MATFDVVLPVKRNIVFPPICVGCEAADPCGSTTLTIIGARTKPVLEMALDSGSAASANSYHEIRGIPICASCAPGLRWYHHKLKFATYTGWIPGLLLMIIHVTPTGLNIILLIAGIVAAPVLSMIFPPPFGATFVNGDATYEFRRKTVAEAFQQLNPVSK
jgi:hypothetical protein